MLRYIFLWQRNWSLLPEYYFSPYFHLPYTCGGYWKHAVTSRYYTSVWWLDLGIQCIFLVRPEDVVTEVGTNASFQCATNASSSSRRGIRWIYTAERNFRSPSHIYAHGRMFPKWRMRHNVTESNEGLFTLTISPVNSDDIGFYTCMDLSDDSKVTAELTLSTGEFVYKWLIHFNYRGFITTLSNCADPGRINQLHYISPYRLYVCVRAQVKAHVKINV